MKRTMIYRVLAAMVLCAAAQTVLANPPLQRANSLIAAPAMVVGVNGGNVTLRVRSVGRDPVTFEISSSCLFGGGLQSRDNLFNNERVVIWTQSSRTGTLPLIYRIDRDKN